MGLTASLILIGISVLASMFFSGSETGVLSINEIELRHKADKGNNQARILLKLLRKKDVLLATLLIGNNLSNVMASAVTASLMTRPFGALGPELTTLIVTPVILIFGEIIPKTVYLSRGTGLLTFTVWLLTACVICFKPLAKAVVFIPRWLTRRPGQSGDLNRLTREDLLFYAHTGTARQTMPREELQMIINLLAFSAKKVRSAMVPMIDVVSIPETAPVRAAAQLFQIRGVSRLPVIKESTENVTGILFAVDLLDCSNPDLPVSGRMRKPFFVPEQTKVTDLLPEIWNIHELAVVVDEYGVAVGIITGEDLVEEIVGDIKDEFDRQTESEMIPLVEGVYIVSAGIGIGEFNNMTGNRIPPGDYATLAGFITNHIQRIPDRGDKLYLAGMEIRILEATPRRINKVLVRLDARKT
ncbi:HlyC/CorC family transporter [bacterium]|nr:HlyC/CorC family transporter [candidate division CSSED10-310 bacterium]